MLVIIVITELYLYKIMDIYYLAKELGTLHNRTVLKWQIYLFFKLLGVNINLPRNKMPSKSK